LSLTAGSNADCEDELMAGVLTGLIVTLVVSWTKLDNFNYEATRSTNEFFRGQVLHKIPQMGANLDPFSAKLRQHD
jgi:hypothetical protein